MNGVCMDFPILFSEQRSLKKNIVSRATGGAIMRDASDIRIVRALDDVSLSLNSGDRVGLIGHNGSGKSTLLRVIAGIYEPNVGQIQVDGWVMPLLDIGLGLNPELTGRQNVYMRGLFLGLSKNEIDEIIPELDDFTQLGEYMDIPLKTYSSGMQMRLSVALLTAVRPDIVLMDEWVLAGDEQFMDRVGPRIENFVESAGLFVLASHSEAIIKRWCNKVALFNKGRLICFDSPQSVFEEYHALRSEG